MSVESKNNDAASEAPPNQDTLLNELAKKIKCELAKFKNSLGAALSHAKTAGEALKKAKERIKDNGGSWGRWLKKNLDLSDRQAQKYMQVATDYDSVAQQGHDMARFTINKFLQVGAKSRSNPTIAPETGAQPVAGREEKSPYRLSQTELTAKKRETQRFVSCDFIRFSDDTPEGKFVQEKAKTLIDQIRKQAAKLLKQPERNESVQEVHLAMAVAEQLGLLLCLEAVVEVVELTPKAPPSEQPATPVQVGPQGSSEMPRPQEVVPSPELPADMPLKASEQNGQLHAMAS